MPLSFPTKTFRFWPLVLVLVLSDCTTKDLAVDRLGAEYVPHEIVGDVIRFTLAYNPGAAMGLSFGDWDRPLLVALSCLALLILISFYRRTPDHADTQVIALALLVGGALGNLFDRVRSELGVVDFIDIGFGSLRFWTFNLADVAISAGALLFIGALFQSAARHPTDHA